jgi:hypothetical protein
MRRFITLGLALTAFGWLFVTPGHAQRGASPRGGMAWTAPGYAPGAAAGTGGYGDGPDLLRPYGSRAGAATPNTARPYTRSPSRPAPPPRPELIVRQPVRPQGVRDYYPTLRAGQGPNRNMIDPRSLCVAGRRAVILRGR